MLKKNDFTKSDVWYPSRSDFSSEQAFNAHRQAFDRIYALQDQLRELHEKVKATSSPTPEKSSSASKINGLNVKAVPPSQGRSVTNLSKIPVLGYNSETGEVEWVIPN